MIDMFTRPSLPVFVNSKSPPVFVEKIIQHWIGAGWGVMEGIIFDNGGEFNNSEMREVASILNIQLSSTPAESPWINGLCERNHQITDQMLEILTEENPKTDENTLLAGANVAIHCRCGMVLAVISLSLEKTQTCQTLCQRSFQQYKAPPQVKF